MAPTDVDDEECGDTDDEGDEDGEDGDSDGA
jgi:hypothetical protein